MKKIAKIFNRWWPSSAGTPLTTVDDDQGVDIELQHAWSLSARLAALPVVLVVSAPPEIAALIREAQTLHQRWRRHSCGARSKGKALDRRCACTPFKCRHDDVLVAKTRINEGSFAYPQKTLG